jgi:hypothetical protein
VGDLVSAFYEVSARNSKRRLVVYCGFVLVLQQGFLTVENCYGCYELRIDIWYTLIQVYWMCLSLVLLTFACIVCMMFAIAQRLVAADAVCRCSDVFKRELFS